MRPWPGLGGELAVSYLDVGLNAIKGGRTVVKYVIEGTEGREKLALFAANISNMLSKSVNEVSEQDDIRVQRCNRVLFDRAVDFDHIIELCPS